jgi:menaquinol-cytochrome c reductase cytochrome b/c subunit
MASRRIQERKAQHARYKQDVEREGKSFFPHAMFHDTVMSLVVVAVIAGLAAIWYYDSDPEPGAAGILGPRYTEEADPGTTSFVPRPDWYFFFLFYLLRIFHWPESVILGTVGIPTILLILLLAVPFLDRRRERRLVRRPVAVVASLLVIASMGILTYKGATAEEPSATSAEAITRNVIPDPSEEVLTGAGLFAQVGCLNCHTYNEQGSPNLGAPELTDVGSRLDQQTIARTIRNGRGAMPAFQNLTDEQLQALATFLDASQGGGGGG